MYILFLYNSSTVQYSTILFGHIKVKSLLQLTMLYHKCFFVRIVIVSLLFVCSCDSFSIKDPSSSLGTRPVPKVHLCISPLIGGPRFLPLHFQLVTEEYDCNTVLDFIPQNAREQSTLISLMTGKSVPGELRCFQKSKKIPIQNSRLILQSWELPGLSPTMIYSIPTWYQEQYSSHLNLFQNNCATFVLAALQKLKMEAV